MADKQLDFGHIMGEDPESLDIQRRQMMAKALQEAVMKAQGGDKTYRRSPVAVIADFMTAQKAKQQGDQAATDSRNLLAKNQQLEQGELDEILKVVSSGGDPREGIARAMASRFPRVQKYGADMGKTNSEGFGQLIQHMGDRIDPQSAISSGGAGGYTGGLRPAPPVSPPQLQSQMDPGGKMRNWVQHADQKGNWHVNPLSDPASTRVDVNNGKATNEIVEQIGKFYAAGGKGYDQGQQIQAQLGNTSEMLRTLQENPQMGAGADGLQALRKWYETMGGEPIPMTGNAEQMKMLLGQNVIKTLGGLGNQVSNSDVKFMQDALGSLESDPRALRRFLLISMKYQMKNLAKLEGEAKQANQTPGLESFPFPGYQFKTQLPNDMDGNDLELLFQNKMPPLMPPGLKPASRIRPKGP